jgi:ribosomal protein S27E
VDDYVEHTVDNLLSPGLFVPMHDVHCSNCQVESQVSQRDLDTSIQCEFCGGALAKLQSGH